MIDEGIRQNENAGRGKESSREKKPGTPRSIPAFPAEEEDRQKNAGERLVAEDRTGIRTRGSENTEPPTGCQIP